MFKLNDKYEINRNILKCDYIRYSPSEVSTINTANSRTYINVPREDSVISLLNRLIILNFDLVQAGTNKRYVDGNDTRLVSLGSIALFSNHKLTAISGKQLEDIFHPHRVSLMYKIITSFEVLMIYQLVSIVINTRQRELTNSRNHKGKNHLRIILEDVFGFAEHHEKATYGLGYKVIITRRSDKAVLNKFDEISIGKLKINGIERYVPHHIGSLSQKTILTKQILGKVPTELQNVERSFFMKKVDTQNLRTFELGTQEGINVPIKIFVGFQPRDRQDPQILNKDTFYRPPVTAQCIIRTEKYPDAGIILKNDDDEYSEAYGQIKEAFKALTKDDKLQPYISDNVFRSCNNDNDIGYNLYVFDISYQKNQEAAQPIKV